MTATAETFHAQIRDLLERSLEMLGDHTEENPHAAIMVAESTIRQAAAAATGYRAIASVPGHF